MISMMKRGRPGRDRMYSSLIYNYLCNRHFLSCECEHRSWRGVHNFERGTHKY
jgi:hypothetical protein